ncbi:hypothetical protein [Candidatus Ruthturnera calyptogenae]|nr:hypothetical protein [Candidatus Ruthturnera calyptogenae]
MQILTMVPNGRLLARLVEITASLDTPSVLEVILISAVDGIFD